MASHSLDFRCPPELIQSLAQRNCDDAWQRGYRDWTSVGCSGHSFRNSGSAQYLACNPAQPAQRSGFRQNPASLPGGKFHERKLVRVRSRRLCARRHTNRRILTTTLRICSNRHGSFTGIANLSDMHAIRICVTSKPTGVICTTCTASFLAQFPVVA